MFLQEVARGVGISAARLSRLERGVARIDMELMIRLAGVLGVTPVDLFPPEYVEHDAMTPEQLCAMLRSQLQHMNSQLVRTEQIVTQLCALFPGSGPQ